MIRILAIFGAIIALHIRRASITSATVGDSTLRRVRVSVAVADTEDEDETDEAAAEAETKVDEEEVAENDDADEDADEDASAEDTCTGADDDDDDVDEDSCGDMADWSARSCGPASFSLKASSRHAPAASLRLALSIRFLRHSASK